MCSWWSILHVSLEQVRASILIGIDLWCQHRSRVPAFQLTPDGNRRGMLTYIHLASGRYIVRYRCEHKHLDSCVILYKSSECLTAMCRYSIQYCMFYSPLLIAMYCYFYSTILSRRSSHACHVRLRVIHMN